MQQELEELRDVKDAAQDVAGLVEIPEGNEDEPLTLVWSFFKDLVIRNTMVLLKFNLDTYFKIYRFF